MATSWGNYPKLNSATNIYLPWRDSFIDFSQHKSYLPFGQGRSYGDNCLNDQGALIHTNALNKLISFERELGIIECEAGITLFDLLNVVEGSAWTLPVVPGTQYVSVGGAIANDVHGKNHHVAGSFGCYVKQFALLRSNNRTYVCNNNSHSDLFKATIGGLGLTGLILSATIQLKKITTPLVEVHTTPFANLDAFHQLNQQAVKQFEYTAAWLDCSSEGHKLGRGIYFAANFIKTNTTSNNHTYKCGKLSVPFYLPNFSLNALSVNCFNQVYFWQQSRQPASQIMHYRNFLFPLDGVQQWNRIYGKRGFIQCQFVLPPQGALPKLKQILQLITHSKQASFLTVLKSFGDKKSPGMLSFPREGLTLALDLPNKIAQQRGLLAAIEHKVMQAGGRFYPAKDAWMSGQAFKHGFANWQQFSDNSDRLFQSSFWRRVMTDDK